MRKTKYKCPKTGRPLAVPHYHMTQEDWDRFWAQVDKTGPNGCWIFTPKREVFHTKARRDLAPTRIILDHVLNCPDHRVKNKKCGIIRCCKPEHQILERLEYEP